MNEQDPWLDDFFSEVSKAMQENKPVDSLFAKPVETSEMAPGEREEWTRYQIITMDGIFKLRDGEAKESPRILVPWFRDIFEEYKRQNLTPARLDDIGVKFLRMTTLGTLAEAAEGEHRRLAQKLVELSGSYYVEAEREAGRWYRIADVVKIASEIKG